MFTLDNFYKSKEWEALIEQLKLERVKNGEVICEYCCKPIVKKYDCIAHHKIELTEANVNNYDISLNSDNIMLIHHRCHNKIHERFGGFKQKVFIVYGSPCSGKTTWVNDVAYDDDLILDIDKIWEAICTGNRERKSKRLNANVFGLRDALIDMVKTRTGMWRNAYIIGGYPLASDRERLASMLGAELIFIDEEKDVCLNRAPNEQWKQFIEDWFETYTV